MSELILCKTMTMEILFEIVSQSNRFRLHYVILALAWIVSFHSRCYNEGNLSCLFNKNAADLSSLTEINDSIKYPQK